MSAGASNLLAMRLIVARCTVSYSGRLATHLPESVRLLMIKEDGTFMVWSDAGGHKVKPLNCDLTVFRGFDRGREVVRDLVEL
jgi:RecB family endonuclease NucS